MERQFLIYFYPFTGILYSTRENGRKKNHVLPSNVAVSDRFSTVYRDPTFGADALIDQAFKTAADSLSVDARRTVANHCNRKLILFDCMAD
jgi:hypothetical protein